MEHSLPFAEVLEAVDRLTWEEQETLVAIVNRRITERGRKRLIAEVQEAQREFAEGLCRPSTTDELMDEILS
ncbi:MAG: hypothetical protein ABSH35_06190 [Isosphaeraceae bacterium]